MSPHRNAMGVVVVVVGVVVVVVGVVGVVVVVGPFQVVLAASGDWIGASRRPICNLLGVVMAGVVVVVVVVVVDVVVVVVVVVGVGLKFGIFSKLGSSSK